MAALPDTATRPATHHRPRQTPRYNVVLLDDNEHTYAYVIGMLQCLFHFTRENAYRMACEVDTVGRVVLMTTVLEQAEFKRDQIHAFGADWRIVTSQGSMSAVIEPAPGA